MRNTTQIIPIIQRGEQEQWVDARTLHRFLEVGKDFSNWIKDYITDFDFVEGRDFSPNLAKSTGGRQAIEYTITMDMAKELSMLQRSEKGKQARLYFIQAEKELRKLQAAFIEGFDAVQQLLAQVKPTSHLNSLWYPAGQLRRLSGKTSSGSYSYKLRKMQPLGTATKLPHNGIEAWFVRQDAVADLLCIKPSHMIGSAMVKLLKAGGAHA
ncbi:MAG: hypothetical protein ABS68_00155 [Niastella sp. SCN 39-18]|nr:antA/AntB antirepressor family protein [Sphingobacteriales bacterium]ODT55165.1 MAG: hypothetical protein ABS68_00155 [Niastella sp. SCN 39-18]OJW09123.1 MAG: hypothetical protein BGO53_00250 [Sphingobacteriales bacterium 39-19]